LEATKLLENIPRVKIIVPSIAYEDKDRRLYVAQWNDYASPTVDNLAGYIRKLSYVADTEEDSEKKQRLTDKSRELRSRIAQVAKILKTNNFFDSDPYKDGKNAGYDVEEDTILLFDLNRQTTFF